MEDWRLNIKYSNKRNCLYKGDLKMRKLNKTLVIVMIFVLTVSTLTGCRKKFDAKEYIEAILDSITSMDYSHLEELMGKNAADEMESSMQEMWNSFVDSAKESMGEDTADKFWDVFCGYLKKAKYNVQDAVETEDGYEVSVLVQPIMIFDGVMERLQTDALEYYQEAQDDLDADALNKWSLDRFVEILSEKLENNDISYGEEQTVTLHVNEKGEVPEEESNALGASLFNAEMGNVE